MKRYEVIREIFNKCSNNQMRDVFVENVETDDLDEYMNRYRVGSDISEQRTVEPDGTVVYDIVCDGLHQRISFTEA
jgi:hypothetical protein